MRIERLEVACFGPLGGQRLVFGDGLALVLGPNEAGKSTLLAAIETVLFGFGARTFADHPLGGFAASVDESLESGAVGELALVADLVLDQGSRLRVERSLGTGAVLSTRDGSGASRSRAGNGALAELAGHSRELFRALWALGPDSLGELPRSARDPLQRMLAGDTGPPGAPGVGDLARELGERARKLWREDHRGKPHASELRGRIAAARGELARAQAGERTLRAALEERERLTHEIAASQARRRALLVERADLALLAELASLETHERALAELDPALLAEDIEDPRTLERRVAELESRLAGPRARVALAPRRLGEREVALLEAEAEIRAYERAAPRHETEIEKLAELHERSRRLEREALSFATELFGRELARGELAAIGRAPLAAWQAALRAWTEEFELAGSRLPRSSARWSHACLAVALALLVLYMAELVPPVLAAAALLLVVIAYAGARSPSREGTEPPVELTQFLDLGLDPASTTTPAGCESVIGRLRAIAGTLRTAEDERAQAAELAETLEEREEAWAALADRLGIAWHGDGLEILTRLVEACRDARSRAVLVEEDALEREQAQLALEAHEVDLEEARGRVSRARSILARFAPRERDPSRAHELFLEARGELEYVRRSGARLGADPRAGRLHRDARMELALLDPRAWSHGEDERIARELAALDEDLARAQRRCGEIDEQVRNDPGGSVARAAEEVEAWQAELARVARKRDGLAILERTLGEAQRRFRAEHGQDVLARASEWLARVTDGRWTRIEWAGESADALCVAGRDAPSPIALAHPLSRGLRDQAQLCLRLGLVDHFDEGKERLPLLLDEVFAHWDARRRAALHPVLREISSRRQVILLTCHEFLARELEREHGIERAQRLSLPLRPPGVRSLASAPDLRGHLLP